MARPPVDDYITVAHLGRLWWLRVDGPSFTTTDDTSFPVTGERGLRLWLNASDEDVVWSRRRVDAESLEAQAMVAAEALR